jgi:hypothetical protein
MNLYSFLRWNFVSFAVAICLGFAFSPSKDLSSAVTSDQDDWAPIASPPSFGGMAYTRRLAEMTWWGVEVTKGSSNGEERRISQGDDGVARVKVDWLLHGVVSDEEGTFALIASDSSTSLQRFSQGAILPGGERLERISKQGIRFSFAEDGEVQDFVRKLYAPQQ